MNTQAHRLVCSFEIECSIKFPISLEDIFKMAVEQLKPIKPEAAV